MVCKSDQTIGLRKQTFMQYYCKSDRQLFSKNCVYSSESLAPGYIPKTCRMIREPSFSNFNYETNISSSHCIETNMRIVQQNIQNILKRTKKYFKVLSGILEAHSTISPESKSLSRRGINEISCNWINCMFKGNWYTRPVIA